MRSGGTSPARAATRKLLGFVTSLAERFYLLAEYPQLGRRRDDWRPGLRSFTAGNYVILYRIDGEDVLIVHLLHGRRDIEGLLAGEDGEF